MNSSSLTFLLALLTLNLGAARADEPKKSPPAVEGLWEGKLSVGAVELRLGFSIQKNQQGELSGIWESIDQGAKGPSAKSLFRNRRRPSIWAKRRPPSPAR